MKAAADMIESGNYNAEVLYRDPAVRTVLAGMTRSQVYNKYKYLRKLHCKRVCAK